MKRLCTLWWKLPGDYRELICVFASFGLALFLAWLVTHWS